MAKKNATPKDVKGTHLTITYDTAGQPTFKWDWDQLAKEIAEATGFKQPTPVKKPRKKKDPK